MYSQNDIAYQRLRKFSAIAESTVIAAVGAMADREVFGGFHRLLWHRSSTALRRTAAHSAAGEVRLKKIEAELLDDRDVTASVQEAAQFAGLVYLIFTATVRAVRP
jgi:hypothetical protein